MQPATRYVECKGTLKSAAGLGESVRENMKQLLEYQLILEREYSFRYNCYSCFGCLSST